jgi:hypothetical protein
LISTAPDRNSELKDDIDYIPQFFYLQPDPQLKEIMFNINSQNSEKLHVVTHQLLDSLL